MKHGNTQPALGFAAMLLTVITLSGCVSNQPKLGGGGSLATGSGGAAGARGESNQLVKCRRPIGTAALINPNMGYGMGMRSTIAVPGILPTYLTMNPYGVDYTGLGLTSPIPVVKLIMSQSGCFRVVDRGAGSAAIDRERAIAAGGQFQKDSNMGIGQMVAADYIITPTITRNNPGASGGLGALGGLIPGIGGLAAAALTVRNKEAQVMLSVTNVRTGVQEAIAEGSATKTDLGFGGLGYYGLGGLGGAYQNTDMGKMVAAAFIDAHNNLVTQLRAIKGIAASTDNAGFRTTATVNLRAGASKSAAVLASIAKGTHVVHSGVAIAGWWEVDVHGHSGWIHSNFIAR